ncbi:uncharacterized protein LOC121522714 isoform X1 [Cheilinus undulatus]|uniref:uncharacterized protein LOC121522714 isoform X1 n=1 Tax=Cheilinus undulatus TaxID=241271 RepID=UPI001BD438E4|nr:uncharacterized protein LOC121522714 isoform X1 [Cheilinus undulatus]
MYLENSEKRNVSEEEESSTEAMIGEQCQVSKITEAEDLSSPSRDSELNMKVCVDYTEQNDNSTDSFSDCNMKDELENFTFCSGLSESFESEESFESDHTADKCDTSGLSQPFDECAQHCECFKPCKSSGHCANHSLASECSPCCEHCAEHLQLCEQCKPSDQQFESFDSEPDPLASNCDSLEQFEMSDLMPECTDDLELLQQYETSDQQYEGFDSGLDASIEESELCESTNISASVDSLDCSTDLFEYEEIQTESNEDNTEDFEEGYPQQQEDRQMQSINEEYAVYLDDNANEYREENSQLDIPADANEIYETEDPETSQECDPNEQCETSEKHNPGKPSELYSEEDCSSYCSSIETKSFNTCPECSIPSDRCSVSSGESEKETQEDSGDEQLQWESFEDDEYVEQSDANESSKVKEKSPAADIVIENYFDLFDRADYYGQAFAQKQRYISCFDGGDIHDRLFSEAIQSEVQRFDRYKKDNEETQAQETDTYNNAPEEVQEETYQEESLIDDNYMGSSESEKPPEDWIVEQESESEAISTCAEESDEAEEDDEASSSESRASENSSEEESERSSMCAPCADDISVDGDAYEDQNCESPDLSTDDQSPTAAATESDEEDNDELEPEDNVYIDCSEMEPYWYLIDQEENEEFYEPGVEEYYQYQMKSIQWQVNELISEEKAKIMSLVFFSEEERTTDEESDEDPEFREISRELKLPLDLIHSVIKSEEKDAHTQLRRTEENKASEQSEDSEEEQTDDESSETCECEYCIPPTEQVPAKPLLPRMKSNDAGKICVVIDLDETLVHSSFKPVNNADFIIPVEIDGTVHQVYVLKRPHVDEFLKRMGEMFECVLFTASLSKYADPVSDLLDKWGAFRSRLFRESCVFHKGNYVKDLSRLGRDLNKVIIIDNSPASYIFHPDNAVPVASWFDDMSDTELLDLIPFFERLSKVDDIYDILQQQRTSS